MSVSSRLLTSLTIAIGLAGCQTPPPAVPVAYTGPVLPIEQSDRGVQIFLPSSVLFETGSATFNAQAAQPYLQRVAHLVKTKTDKRIAVEGHADNTGSAAVNQPLSEARAASVREALVTAGISPQRIEARGFAANRPLASNATEPGRSLNRRVELIILDEQVAKITAGEPADAFSSAWAQLKAMIESGAVKPAETPR